MDRFFCLSLFCLSDETDRAGENYVLGQMGRWSGVQRVLAAVLAVVVGLSLGSCGSASQLGGRSSKLPKIGMVKLSEVAPPPVIRSLRQEMEVYQPQVSILSPKPNEVVQDTNISVRFKVQDLPLFQNEEFGLSPHLHVIVDNQPYSALYDVSKPFELKDLEPGTHTLRAFASRPWHESFKNDGAYAQTTFHVFAKTPEASPDLKQPLLTYSRPKGSYGAEPVMLDFYLANAPLHLVAQADDSDNIQDWQVRCTIDGESFTIDRWEPIYLKGLKPGKNWVQLELLDEKGKVIPNAFNNTVRLIDYQPGGTDTLSKLVRNELTIAEVRGIIDPNYVYVPEPEVVEPAIKPVVEPVEPTIEPTPAVVPVPILDTEPTLEPVLPGTLPVPVPEVVPPEQLLPAVLDQQPDKEPNQIENEKQRQELQEALKRSEQPQTFTPKKPVVRETPLPFEEPAAEKVKDQFPEEVKELLKKADELKSPAPEAPQPNLSPKDTVEIVPPIAAPVIAPAITPDSAVPSSGVQPSSKPILRQWRDRLKQFVPLPEAEQPSEANPAILKGLSDRAKGLWNQPTQTPLDSSKEPKIIDIPASEDFQTPIAEPNLDQAPALNVRIP